MFFVYSAQSHNAVVGPVEVKLLCGADVLESFAIAGLWKPEHVMKFNIHACCSIVLNLSLFRDLFLLPMSLYSVWGLICKTS